MSFGDDNYGTEHRLWPDYSVLHAMTSNLDFCPTDLVLKQWESDGFLSWPSESSSSKWGCEQDDFEGCIQDSKLAFQVLSLPGSLLNG